MMEICGVATLAHFTVVARPNCSLSPIATILVFFAISCFSLLIAFAFLLIGAWPVLPFAGLELLALGFCFYHVLLHSNDYERLCIDDDHVVVETHELKSNKHIELSGYWSRVVLDCMSDGYCRRLLLRSHGKEIEFGRYLNSEERLSLARQLRPRLGGFQS